MVLLTKRGYTGSAGSWVCWQHPRHNDKGFNKEHRPGFHENHRLPHMKFFNQKQLAITLLCALAAPFVIFGFLLVAGGSASPLPVAPVIAIHSYGVLCASFFAGIQWGVHFCKRTEDSVYLLSFFTLVLAWLSLLSPGTITGLVVILVGFLLSWVGEYRLSQQRVTTAWFWKIRCISTVLIVLSLLLTISALASGRVS
jgi:hypothetical protein